MYYPLDFFISTNLQNQHLVLEGRNAYSYWDTFAMFQETSVYEQTTHVALSFRSDFSAFSRRGSQ